MPCGDWNQYKDEKCFKIIDKVGLENYSDAKKTCVQNDSTSNLASIRSVEEQTFLSDILFKTNKTVNNVWIGAKNTNNKFKWTDDSDLSFTNWAEGSPKNKTDYCVQLQSDESSPGKWVDVLCTEKNLVLCEKSQQMSLSSLQMELSDAKKYFTSSLEDFKKHQADQQSKLDHLLQNPIPIGFIYVQLPDQPEPNTLWPKVEWKDVTTIYAGLFFRAEGGKSAKFGDIQEESCPKLTHVKYNYTKFSQQEIDIVVNTESKPVITSAEGSGNGYSLMFTVSGSEVRPRNKALRIWKRIK